MDTGELLTRSTAWLALLLYAAGETTRGRLPGAPRDTRPARVLWTAGCAVFLGHVATAFHYYHGWSHAAAAADTAHRTAELTGWAWGGGLWFNYAFATVWLADAAWWWLAPHRHERVRGWSITVRGFLFFMVFNGAVVFVRGPLRWLGLALCLVVVGGWVCSWRDIWQRMKHGAPRILP